MEYYLCWKHTESWQMKELVYLLTLCIPVYPDVVIFSISSMELNKYSPVLTLKTNMMIYLQLNKIEKFQHKVVLNTYCSQLEYLL